MGQLGKGLGIKASSTRGKKQCRAELVSEKTLHYNGGKGRFQKDQERNSKREGGVGDKNNHWHDLRIFQGGGVKAIGNVMLTENSP